MRGGLPAKVHPELCWVVRDLLAGRVYVSLSMSLSLSLSIG